jgi:hypothetical protein
VRTAQPCQACGRAHPSTPLVVRRRAELIQLTRWFGRRASLCIALPELPLDENHALQVELERDYLECGCQAGKYGLLVGLTIALALIAAAALLDHLSVALLLSLAPIALGTSLAGKGAGILRARLRLSRRVSQLLSEEIATSRA